MKRSSVISASILTIDTSHDVATKLRGPEQVRPQLMTLDAAPSATGGPLRPLVLLLLHFPRLPRRSLQLHITLLCEETNWIWLVVEATAAHPARDCATPRSDPDTEKLMT